MAIVEAVWDYDFDPGTNLVDVYIMRLREKIDAGFEPKLLHTLRGVRIRAQGVSMSIRRRLTLWLASILLLSLMVMAGVFRFELREDRERVRRGEKLPSSWEETGEFLMYFGLPMAVLLLVGSSLLMRRFLRPISQLTEAVENLHLHRLNERLPPVGTGDELDRLTEVFNAMSARLEASVAHMRDFTMHASHELKTPLTIMRGELEAALMDDSLTNPHRERVASELEEVQRLAQIVEGLTLLAKADAGQVPMSLEPVALCGLVEDSYADAQMLARAQGITVTMAACEDVTVKGDPRRLRQLLLNLTENAVKYAEPHGRVEISLKRVGDSAELQIANTGQGIPPEQLPRVFERF